MAVTSLTSLPKSALLSTSLLLFGAALLGATQVTITRDASQAMLPSEGIAYQQYQEYLHSFPSDNGAILVFVDLLCDSAGWDLLVETDRRLRQLDLVERTVSLASPTTKYIKGSQDNLFVSRFSEFNFLDSQARCAAAASYEPYSGLLVSSDGKTAAIHVIARRDVDATTFTNAILESVAPTIATAAQLGGRLLVTGEPILSATLAGILARDSIYILVTIALMLAATALMTRSARTVAVSAALMAFVLTTAYGCLGWLSLELTAASSLAIFLLAPLSAAFVIHAHGYLARSSKHSIYPPGSPSAFLLAGVSTAIGFACTGLTPSPDIRLLALTGVVGIAAATAGSFLFVFPLLRAQDDPRVSFSFAIPRWTFVRPEIGFALIAFYIIAISYGLAKITFEYRPADYLPITNPARADFERVGDWFGRMTLPVVVKTSEITRPRTWTEMASLVDSIESQPDARITTSWLYDQMSELTKAASMGEEGEVTLAFPDSSQLFEQLLMWFDPDDLELFVNQDADRILLLLHVPFIGSLDYFELKEKISRYFEENQIDGYIVGRIPSFFETGHRIGPDNLRGLAIGAMAIFLLLLLIFRSLTFALIAIFTNALPVLTALAVLGILDVPIDMGSSIVAAMAFGIVLDDSTHLLVRIKQLRSAGYDPATAVVTAVRDLTAPIVTTTLVIGCGFLVLFLAEVRVFHDFAAVMLASMSTALIADLVLLPVLARTLIKDPVVSAVG